MLTYDELKDLNLKLSARLMSVLDMNDWYSKQLTLKDSLLDEYRRTHEDDSDMKFTLLDGYDAAEGTK